MSADNVEKIKNEPTDDLTADAMTAEETNAQVEVARQNAANLTDAEFVSKTASAESHATTQRSESTAGPVRLTKPGRTIHAYDDSSDSSGRDFSYTLNREISWLRFNDRVLDEAFDQDVPLYERLKFCEIFDSNLEEWFMVRVGGLTDLSSLKNQPRDNKSNKTPTEQLDDVFAVLPPLVARHERALFEVEDALAPRCLARITPAEYTDADRAAVARHFERRLAPIISPMVVDPRHPFPNLRNGRLFVACALNSEDEHGLLGLIEVPTTEPRVVPLPSSGKAYRYTLIEDVIRSCLSQCFGDYMPKRSAVLRVTRNADIDPDGEGVEEEEDYRLHMKKVLKLRQRLQPVRLEIQGKLGKSLENFIIDQLGLEQRRVFHVSRPLDLSYIYSLESHIPESEHSLVTFPHFEPQNSSMCDVSKPMREQVEDHDILLTYPYEAMTPLLHLIREAAAEKSCISIKITLYRVAKSSHLCESLISAAEAGKEVTVLMELRARFDEENNIAWAERLEDAGCTVIYGSEGFKCHSKICQITYHDDFGISRITCLGTGNFNEKTVKLYSDFMLLTADEGIGADGNTFFRNLSLGNLRGSYHELGVAPVGLKPLVMRGLEREMGRARAGEPARVFFKMNSLTDRDVIDKIAEACQAGVQVVMVVRSICCIRANIPGKTEGLVVHQIVGRFLEHARIYAFGADSDLIYLSSADMMTRNTERRVEIAFPVLDDNCKEIVRHFIDLQLSDNVKARQLNSEGAWEHIEVAPGEKRVNAQEVLLAEAVERANAAATAYAQETRQGEAQAEAESLVGEAPSEVSPQPQPRQRAFRENATTSTSAQASSSATSAATATSAVSAETAPDTSAKSQGRISRAFSLFGEGFRTLFGGK